jgi:dihydroorotate dehydrogenase
MAKLAPATEAQIAELTKLIMERDTKGLAIINSLGIKGMVRVNGGLSELYVTNLITWINKFHPMPKEGE